MVLSACFHNYIFICLYIYIYISNKKIILWAVSCRVRRRLQSLARPPSFGHFSAPGHPFSAHPPSSAQPPLSAHPPSPGHIRVSQPFLFRQLTSSAQSPSLTHPTSPKKQIKSWKHLSRIPHRRNPKLGSQPRRTASPSPRQLLALFNFSV